MSTADPQGSNASTDPNSHEVNGAQSEAQTQTEPLATQQADSERDGNDSNENTSTATLPNGTSSETPASPPLPSPHKPVAPGVRASRFIEAYHKIFERTVAKVTWDNFTACYPTMAERSPGVLRKVYAQWIERFGALCKREFETVLKNREAIAKLNELDGLIGAAERRRDEAMDDVSDPPIPPHALPAPAVLAAHLAPILAQQQSHLNARLQTTQSLNAQLATQVAAQRAEMESLVALLERLVTDVDAANEAMDGVVHEIAEETREVEAERRRGS